MDDPSKIEHVSDDELLSRVRINLPGNISREQAKTEIQFRYTKRLMESINLLAQGAERTEESAMRMTKFASSTEKSGRRMEFATWVILLATLVQLGLVVISMLRNDKDRISSTSEHTEAMQVTTSEDTAKNIEQVKTDPKTWGNAEIEVTCSKEKLVPWTARDGKSKQVTLDCDINNLTDKAVPLVAHDKVDALFLLPGGRAARGRAYLGSNQHEVSARGKIEKAGLFPGDKECPVMQSDRDCVTDELMNSKELLLTDTVSGVRYHVIIK